MGVKKMIQQFDLLTDSCCDLPAALMEEEEIKFVSMTVNINGKEYIDDLGKTFDYQEFITHLKEGAMPTTSQINIGTYLEAFEPYVNQDIPLLYLAFSSGLSGSYQNAMSAVNLLKEEHDIVPITIVDTKAACLGQGLLVTCVSDLRKKGHTLDHVVAWLEQHVDSLQSWVTVDNLEHLERGGRISKTSATIGGLMKIKPIIHVDDQGKLVNVGKVRGRHKALEKVIAETKKHSVIDQHDIIYVAHADDLEAAEETKQIIERELKVAEVKLFPMGPTIMSHTGTGTIAVFSFGKKR